jgi:hypothetical protein
MSNFYSYLPAGYTSNAIKKIPKDIVSSTALELGMHKDTEAAAVALALTGARWKCALCGNQCKLISYNQGFREYCSTKCSNNSAEVAVKKQKASLQKYGTLFPNQSAQTKAKIREKLVGRIDESKNDAVSLIEKQGFKVLEQGLTFSDSWTFQCECENVFSLVPPTWSRWNNGWKTSCPKCSRGSSSQERQIAKIIEEWGFSVDRRNRTLISPLEIDIYVDSKKLAIEFNGLYWHADDIDRHRIKADACRDAGIRLIQIFEHDWVTKKDIVIARLKSALGMNSRIFARDTIIEEIDYKAAKQFFDLHHLHGNARGAMKFIALKTEGKIVQALSICKQRFKNTHAELEILRSASAEGITVVGGLSKLISYCRKLYPQQSILTYADRCWGEGKSYEKAGGKFLAYNNPGYFWWKGDRIVSRYYTQKRSIQKILGELHDPALSEESNMRKDGWRKIWNAGNSVYLFPALQRDQNEAI